MGWPISTFSRIFFSRLNQRRHLVDRNLRDLSLSWILQEIVLRVRVILLTNVIVKFAKCKNGATKEAMEVINTKGIILACLRPCLVTGQFSEYLSGTMADVRKRKEKFSSHELEVLVEEVHKRKNILFGKFTSTLTAATKQSAGRLSLIVSM